MKKIGIILDSFSGRSKTEIEKMGWRFLPQSIILDNKSYLDGVELILSRDYEKVSQAKDVKTAMPTLGSVMDAFEASSREYENVYYLPINKGLSSTYSTGVAAAKNFSNVHVIDNRFCGTAIIDTARAIERMGERNSSTAEIKKFLKRASDESQTILVPKTVEALIKSGRVAGFKKLVLQKARLIPMLFVSDEGFKPVGIKRNFQKAVRDAWEKIIEAVGKVNLSAFNFEIIYCGDNSSVEMAKALAQELGIKEVSVVWANGPIAGYSGYSAVGLNAWRKV